MREWASFAIVAAGFFGGIATLWYSTWSSRIGIKEFEKTTSGLSTSIDRAKDELGELKARLNELEAVNSLKIDRRNFRE